MLRRRPKIKTSTTFILFLTAILTLAAGSAFGKYGGGTGEPNNPYQIATKADLLALAADTNDYNKCFIMTADIDLDPNLPGNQVFTTAVIAKDKNSANLSFDGNSFNGIFNGAGYKILNLTINTNGTANDYLGLFGRINYGQVRNLGLEDVNIRGTDDSNNPYLNNFNYIGGLAGENMQGNIIGCHTSGDVFSRNGTHAIGGLIGENEGHISDSFSACSVICGDNSDGAGGLTGSNFSGNISNCYSKGTVTGGNSASSLGGIAGWANGDINGCFSTSNISGGPNSRTIGGLIGLNKCDIKDCFATGTVSGESGIGGLIGIHDPHGSVTNCYSTGTVTGGSYIGGLIGNSILGSIISSSYFLDIAGPDNGYGEPLTDAQMKQQASFVGWDFTNETANGTNDFWRMCVNGVNYPHLNWESIAGDFVCPDGVNMEDLSYFVQRWLESDCASSNNYCGETDINTSGAVDIQDFALLAENWLK